MNAYTVTVAEAIELWDCLEKLEAGYRIDLNASKPELVAGSNCYPLPYQDMRGRGYVLVEASAECTIRLYDYSPKIAVLQARQDKIEAFIASMEAKHG